MNDFKSKEFSPFTYKSAAGVSSKARIMMRKIVKFFEEQEFDPIYNHINGVNFSTLDTKLNTMNLQKIGKHNHIEIFQIKDEKSKVLMLMNEHEHTVDCLCKINYENGIVYLENNITDDTSYDDFNIIAGTESDVEFYVNILNSLKK